jgi:alpha-2-macroglobulin
VDAPDDVIQDADGVWHIRAGARVRVNLTLAATSRRYHVALVDSLPAGLEIINPSLAVSESTPPNPNETPIRWGWWWWPWYEHQNLRDARAEAFTTLLWEGAYTYSYVARATTPGLFVAPPARAEEMYAPEVFGRSGSDWVVIK